MNLYYLNFASEPFYFNQEVAVHSARAQGIENIICHTEDSLRAEFPQYFDRYARIANLSRGFGYWLWKPFLISRYLTVLPKDSVLMYADVGIIFSSPVDPIVKAMRNEANQIFFNMPKHLNGAWCKRDVFSALGVDSEECRMTPQVKAQWHFWTVSEDSQKKAEEWLTWSSTELLITDEPSKLPNFPEFTEHRHDQSILSLLVYRWGNEIFRDPTQEGEPHFEKFPNSAYPTTAAAVGKLSSNEAF